MARHQLNHVTLKNDPISVAELETSFRAVMDLPQFILPLDDHYFLIDGRNGVQTILGEINRLNSVHNADLKNPLYADKDGRHLLTAIDSSTHETDSTGSSSTASSTTKSSEHEDEDLETICSLCNNGVLVRERNIVEKCIQCGNTSLESWEKRDVMDKSAGIF